jgi:hypothetical protein
MTGFVLMAVLLSSRFGQSTPTSSAPERFEYAVGGLGSRMRVAWENGKLLVVTSTLNFKGKGGYRNRIERFHPTPEAWERFWKALDAAGVWKWQPYYSGEPCCDDDGWSVELRHAGHSMKSEGYYNYPPQFDAFSNAVDPLINDSRHKRPHPQK